MFAFWSQQVSSAFPYKKTRSVCFPPRESHFHWSTQIRDEESISFVYFEKIISARGKYQKDKVRRRFNHAVAVTSFSPMGRVHFDEVGLSGELN